MVDIAFIVCSALTIAFNIAPLCWQIEHNNSGPICLGIWVIVANLNLLINALIWRKDAINRAPVFCDISSKIKLAAPLGILASDLCILLLLARVVGSRGHIITKRDRRRQALYDYLFCFGFPTFIMAAHIVYQPFRFGIAKATGCLTSLSNTWPTWVCYFIWAPLFSFVGCLLTFYVAYRLTIHRRDFKRLVNNSDSALTTSRFVRLGLLSTAFFLFNLPLSIYSLFQLLQALGPYIAYDWSYIHQDFSYVSYDPWRERATFTNWNSVIAGMLVMVFFGFGSEATSYYMRPIHWARIHIAGKQPRSSFTDVTQSSVSVPTEIRLKLVQDGELMEATKTWDSGKGLSPELDFDSRGPFDRNFVDEGSDSGMAGIQMHRSQEARVA